VTVPFIDLAPFTDGTAGGRAAVARAVNVACTDIGFHQPNYDALIECLPSCCGPGNPPRYEPVTSGRHRLTKFLRGVRAAAPSTRG